VQITREMVFAQNLPDDLVKAMDRAVQLDNGHTGSDGALELAAYWVKTCIANHESCRTLVKAHAKSFVPTRLLDVSNNSIRLIESHRELDRDNTRDFVALSHCWGLVPIIRTLKQNYADHRKQIAPELLSKTFREAVHTTRKLGYHYIWIDSLCIIQDDGDDWAKEAATMCDVYQSAVLTIAAAHAPGGDVGCFVERDGLLQMPFYIKLPSVNANDVPKRIQFTSYGRANATSGGDPVLFSRAWVLQEQLLSPRLLIFDGKHLGWICMTMHGSEGTPTSGATRHSLYQKAIRAGILDDYEFFDDRNAGADGYGDHTFWARIKHQYWCNLVMDYTHRGMTKSKDRLVALAGVAKALSRHTKSEYWAGLWSDAFTTGLLWSLSHNERFLMYSEVFDVTKLASIRHEQPLVPTWSWASVTVPVMYAETELINYDRICEVIGVDVSGSIDKQEGTATIRGHVRRGYVNPVYSSSVREAAASMPHMIAVPPTGRKGLEYMRFKGRSYHPGDYFLFSEQNPKPAKERSPNFDASKHGTFRLMRGSFRPDELIDPCTEITFIAIAQQHFGSSLTSTLHTHDENAALKVHTLALVPTDNKPGEYKRVGLAIWDQCAWYGYLCGWKDEHDRRVYRPGNLSEQGYLQDDTWWDRVARKTWWDDLEALDVCETGKHEHGYEKEEMPNFERYHRDIEVGEETVVII
jgi:hypothetical protein